MVNWIVGRRLLRWSRNACVSFLDRSERAALKLLKEDKDITVLPADKGNATVVMDTAQYEKVKNLLADPVYKKLKKDPTPAT